MKKDVLIAIISGLVLGLIITLGIYTANKSLTKMKTKKMAEQQTETLPSPPLTKIVKKLNITSHQPFDLINQSEITLSGVAWPEAIIGLITETDNKLITADQEGIFSFKFDLIKGFNEITIIATDQTTESQTETIILTYSTTQIELAEEQTSFQLVKPIQAAEANDASSSSITEKIKERLQNTAEVGIQNLKDELINQANTPQKKAFVGKITSINQDQINLRYKSFQNSLSLIDSTEIIQSKGKNKLEIEDLKVDDFILSLGFIFPDSDILQAHLISVIDKPNIRPNKQFLSGPIKEIDNQKIVVDNKRITIDKNTNLNIKDIKDPTVEDLQLDDYLFSIVELDQNGDVDDVLNVLVIPGKNNPAGQKPTNADATDSATATDSSKPE